ncbi:MAG: hypothetical protein EBT89_09925 [Opitutaceae bacterium]|nr:hypothetical protein [Opitutaceae bacterium]
MPRYPHFCAFLFLLLFLLMPPPPPLHARLALLAALHRVLRWLWYLLALRGNQCLACNQSACESAPHRDSADRIA